MNILKWNEEANAYDLYEIKMSSTDEEDNEIDDGKPKKVKDIYKEKVEKKKKTTKKKK